MATPDLLGQLAEVSQLQLHRVTSANSNSSASAQRPTTTTTTTTGSHEPSPVDSSSDSFHSPNSATTTTYLQQQQQQQRYRSEDAQAQAALYPNAVAVDPVTTSSSSSHKAKDGPVSLPTLHARQSCSSRSACLIAEARLFLSLSVLTDSSLCGLAPIILFIIFLFQVITRQRQQVSCAECHVRLFSCLLSASDPFPPSVGLLGVLKSRADLAMNTAPQTILQSTSSSKFYTMFWI